MTRTQKIEALAKADTEDHIINKGLNANHKSFVRGLLAGIALRDEELLVTLGTFDDENPKEMEIAMRAKALFLHTPTESNLNRRLFGMLREKHEQFIKAIKGDG